MKIPILLFFVLILPSSLLAQEMTDTEETFLAQYEIDIKKSRLGGIYIPANLNEALKEIRQLADEETLRKFASAPIDKVAIKLHYGIGRWMMVNWRFHTGSRFSHLLKTKGVKSPDAMAQFMIRLLHADLNGEVLDVPATIEKVNAWHAAELKKNGTGTVIKTEVKKIENPDKN